MPGLSPIAILLLVALPEPPVQAADLPALRVPAGFRVELFADATLANDVQAMTIDAGGRVVVTGPGYVRTLHDDPATRRATRATPFAEPKSGGMGLCFDGDDLLITADGSLSRYRDRDGDGRADGPPERISPFVQGEHGGHAIRKGPDGSFYVVGGNDAGIDARHVTSPSSPVSKPVAGGIVRFSPDFRSSEVVAHGFRNPYDFDFGPLGDLFTYDSDCERDENLPWYTPTRLFRVVEGGHHGWRLKGYMRSFSKRPDDLDAIPPTVDLGRGSPTGVVCYRHTRFPVRYHDGLFLCDWTFGRIWFVPTVAGTGPAVAEVFAEPIGSDGFAPTDACVGPDGSLFVSIGGRRTQGAVYRITHEAGGSSGGTRATGVDAVLSADQPLDAWSRARWVPIARGVGAGPFEVALREAGRPEAERVRAAEVLLELFDGPTVAVAESAWASATDPVRARIAWALSRRVARDDRPARLREDRGSEPVARALLTLAASGRGTVTPSGVVAALSLARAETIPAAARLLSRSTVEMRGEVAASVRWSTPAAQVGHALADLLAEDTRVTRDRTILTALATLHVQGPARLHLDALRLLMIALGDWDLDHPAASADVFAAYTIARPVDGPPGSIDQARSLGRRLLGSKDARVREEAGRLLAMLGDRDEATLRAVAAGWTDTSPPTADLHALIVVARLGAEIPADLRPKVAEALCRLDAKLGGKPGRIKQSWNLRLGELFAELSRRDPALVDALLIRGDFLRESHLDWVARADPASRPEIARALLATRGADGRPIRLDPPVLDLLDALPADESRAILRARPRGEGSEAGIVRRLAANPLPGDRARFLLGLASPDADLVASSLDGLEKVPAGTDPADAAPALIRLRRALADPRARALRERLAARAAREIGAATPTREPADPRALVDHYVPLYAAFATRVPTLGRLDHAPAGGDAARLSAMVPTVDWANGSADRGALAFRDRQCASCHSGGAALGPDLAGVSKRLSRDDLLASIADPNRDVAPAYRPTLVETKDGRSRSGLLVFESGDGLMLQTGPSVVERIGGTEVESRRPGEGSLMPENLLQGIDSAGLADLFAYLKSL